MSYVVTGATGQVGSTVVDYLLKQSVPVHVVIRSAAKAESFRSRNIQVTIADLTDVEGLTKAFEGAKAVFAMNPPAYEKLDMQAVATSVSNALASAIKAAKVERVVVLSSIGSERSSKTGSIYTTHILEEALKESASQVVMIRAGSFTENWLSAVSAVKDGHSPVLGSVFQKLDQKISHVATNDIGRVASEYMLKTKGDINGLVIVELEGPELYSPNDIAKVVSDGLGKSILASAMSEEMMRELFNKFQWPKKNADDFIEMVQGFDDGTICWTTNEKVIRVKGKVTAADVLKKVLN
ncbi:unnamed protein product [Adineta steineri]|uniref:NmrA-like domain-containing protein n=1 Tax=Adineta steineri TaxID=433720 RepID=A0A815YE65_9BILA|nr:unnamed protein product [Adineta steineri]CAF1569611.1 unnamed protein product [Adineta steineri]